MVAALGDQELPLAYRIRQENKIGTRDEGLGQAWIADRSAGLLVVFMLLRPYNVMASVTSDLKWAQTGQRGGRPWATSSQAY